MFGFMEVRFYKKTSAILLIFLFSFPALPKKRSFNQVFRSFSNEVCKPGTEHRYESLLKKYKASALYLPEKEEGVVDKKALSWYFKELRKKERWIASLITSLKRRKDFNQEKTLLDKTQKSLEKLVHLRSDLIKGKTQLDSDKAQKREKLLFKDLKKKFLSLSDHLDFLKGYSFPVDHLADRTRYESLKESSFPKDKQKKARLYLKRKLVEDGTSIEVSYYGDALLRTLFNTLFLSFKNHETLDEKLRYDLDDFLAKVDRQLRRGIRYHIKKNQKWWETTKALRADYALALKGFVAIKDKKVSLSEYLKSKKILENELKNFVLQKQAQTYQYWQKQPEDYQRLYTLLTILYNEVGRIEKKSSIERQDIVKLVYNRYEGNRYSRIPASHQRAELFHQNGRSRWLDVLFKEGEFSFTYFYIPSVVRTFCPDMSLSGRRLRAQNANIVSKIDQKDTKREGAVRYFSRISMIGRIDMSSIWNGFEAIDRFKGQRVRGPSSLIKKLKAGDFIALKEFKEDGDDFWLIKLEDHSYVMRKKDFALFQYRDPALFRFYKPI